MFLGTFFVVFFVFVGSTSCEEHKLRTVALGPAPAPDTTRIIGGVATTIEKYPYTVQVIRSNQLICGGSLLTRRHVLSAAHCFYDENGRLLTAGAIRIRVGTRSANSDGTLHSVSTLVIHERYNSPPRDNDIAVVVLRDAVTFSSRVQAATLPVQGSVVPDNAPVWHVGWGVERQWPFPVMSRYLNEVQVRTVNETVCRSRYLYLQGISGLPFPVTSNMICAGMLDVGGKDACQGDSGGPLVYSGVVVGVTSWGYDCAHPTYPGVSARVAAYTNWLEQTVARYSAGSIHLPSFVVLVASLVALILNTK